MKRTHIALPLLFIVLLASCTKEPVANFTHTADNYTAPVEITFTNSSTDADSYSWDFGDGSSSTEENPVHEFEVYGTIDVRLTAKGRGGEDVVTQQIAIQRPTTYIVGNKTSFTLYEVMSFYWDEGQGDITAWYDHGTMYSGSDSPEIITEKSPLDLYFELSDGSRCLVNDPYSLTYNQLNYMYVYDHTELYFYESSKKWALKPGERPDHALLTEIRENGRLVTFGELK